MDTLACIHHHRSIRRYCPDPVPDALLTELLDAGVRASSSGNMQSYSIIVTRDRALREQLYDCLLYTSPSPRDRTRSRMPSSA